MNKHKKWVLLPEIKDLLDNCKSYAVPSGREQLLAMAMGGEGCGNFEVAYDVATVAIDGAKNAAFLAASILSVKHPEVASGLESFREKTRQQLLKRSAVLKDTGK